MREVKCHLSELEIIYHNFKPNASISEVNKLMLTGDNLMKKGSLTGFRMLVTCDHRLWLGIPSTRIRKDKKRHSHERLFY
jgi:hypothetical protein